MPLLELARQPKVRQAHSPLRLAVIGCGAVTQEYHVPVLAGHDGIRMQAFVDRNESAARTLARAYGVPVVATEVRELDTTTLDAVLIATPPYHHGSCALELLKRGLHVFVEKPMAIHFAEAEAMVRAAHEAGLVLSVGLFRRLSDSTRMMQALIASGEFGLPTGFDVEEGHVYSWSCATLGSMRKDLAGGGVLIDTGSHTLDQVFSFFTGPVELISYQDNAQGGIESDCVLRLRIEHQGKPVEGRIELSRTRQLRNSFQVHTERGTLEFATNERFQVSFRPAGLRLVDPALGTERGYQDRLTWADSAVSTVAASFRAEIDDWLKAIQSGQPPVLSGESALPVVRVIEECYQQRQPCEEPWASPMAEETTETAAAVVATKDVRGRVLVTGASGFIGGRLVEILHGLPGCEVRALVHHPGSASRLAQLPIPMVVGDIRSAAEMQQALQGCDAVVHCAYGSSGMTERDNWATTVQGTRQLLETARSAGVKRFVHISTIAVHGLRVSGTIDETTPVHPDADEYGQAKAAAEKVVGQLIHPGLCTTVLRLSNVYGPFSRPYAVRPVLHLKDGLPVYVGRGEMPSNTVYVDNVVEGILRVLGADPQKVQGQTFVLADGDNLSWADFHAYYARALGVEMRGLAMEELERLREAQAPPGLVGRLLAWPRGVRAVLASPETLALARKAMRTDPLGTGPRSLLNRFPALRRGLKHLFKLDRPAVYRPAEIRGALPPLGLLELYACPAAVCVDKARKVLGYGPVIPREVAMERTVAWLRHARYI